MLDSCRPQLSYDNHNLKCVIRMATKRINRNRVKDMISRARQLFNEGLLSANDVTAVLKIANRANSKLK